MDKLERAVVILSLLWTALLFALYIFNYYKLYAGGA